MNIFTKTKQDEERFSDFETKLDKIISNLETYADCTNINEITKIKKEFQLKINDFFRNDRKLNIGVIGQVKAGKSTFLNTLLFEGKKVLPSAATPKTATLTKIEYSENNSLIVEYYTAEEWQVLERNASTDAKGDEFEAAREIMKMAAENGLNPSEYIVKGSDEITFNSSEELMQQLNDYVGENGKLTALVKNVTVKINRDELKNVSVVDTPGLNDAIVSRTDKTRQFIKLCDVVFFLSRASQFLDKNDTNLLLSQLPQDGVKRLIMVCSRFDDGLADEIFNYESLPETIETTKEQLKSRARSVFSERMKDYMHKEMLEACKEPVFVSAMCNNMSKKTRIEYDSQEQNVFDNLNYYDDADDELIAQIGSFEEIIGEYDNVVASKDETLSRKAREFVPAAEEQLRAVLADLRATAEKKLNILMTGDKEELSKAKRNTELRINDVKGGIETVFGEMLANMELAKVSAMQKLRTASNDCSKLKEKEGVEVHTTSYRVSDFKLLDFSTWGKSHKEYSSYETTYTYVDTNDALENIREFSSEACKEIENIFTKTVGIAETKAKLLQVVLDNFDTSSEYYDPGFFKMITANALAGVEFPVLKMDISKEQAGITAKFTGRVRDSRDMGQLQSLLADIIARLFETMVDKLDKEVLSFRGEISKLKGAFASKLLENIEDSFNELSLMLDNKEKEVKNYENLLVLFKTVEMI